jgi:glycosyltransferase involved in cell wall biosynthesis
MASVGVLVPVRGPAPFLDEALESVLSQDPAPAAVVVVDDASPQPVRVDPAHAQRCTLVRRDVPGGAPGARDTGLERLGTDLVALLDADDAWRSGKLAAQLEALGAHPEAAACFARVRVVDDQGRPTGEQWDALPGGMLDAEALMPVVFERNPIPTSSVVLRRTDLVAAGGFAGPPPCEDQDLWLRLLRRGHGFACVPEVLVDYRRHPAALTADVASLAESSLLVHRTHAAAVDPALARRAHANDLTLLARGRIRQRRYGEARAALGEAAALQPAGARERMLRVLLAVPGFRALLGRRAPYGA